MKTETEEWRAVPSMPTHMASSHGRIMVIPYEAVMPNGGARTYGGHAYYGVWANDERRFITTYRRRTYKVHRMVCEAFNGPPPSGKGVCMHLDEDSKNNAPENLAWGTQRENLNAPGFVRYCKAEGVKKLPRYRARHQLS